MKQVMNKDLGSVLFISFKKKIYTFIQKGYIKLIKKVDWSNGC